MLARTIAPLEARSVVSQGENAWVVYKFCVFQALHADASGDFKIHNHTTRFHRAAIDATTIPES